MSPVPALQQINLVVAAGDEVDEIWRRMTAAGYPGPQPPTAPPAA
jgi:hypothetical protein